MERLARQQHAVNQEKEPRRNGHPRFTHNLVPDPGGTE
jgi:hypothetical protein